MSTEVLANKELVPKNGSANMFLFCASETDGTTWESRSCLLLRVIKAVVEAKPEATLLQAFEKDF